MKCNQSRPGFELMSPCPFPTMITIIPQAPLMLTLIILQLKSSTTVVGMSLFTSKHPKFFQHLSPAWIFSQMLSICLYSVYIVQFGGVILAFPTLYQLLHLTIPLRLFVYLYSSISWEASASPCVPLHYHREFRPHCDPTVVTVDKRKKLCSTTQRFIDYCTCR